MKFKLLQHIGSRISQQVAPRLLHINIMSPVSSPTKTSTPVTASASPSKNNLTKKKPAFTISVDGNISSGKSTLVATLCDYIATHSKYGVETIPEPLEKWTNVGGHNLLEMLYQDTTKNNFIFQHYVQLTRLMDTLKSCEPEEEELFGKIRVMERSIQNNRYCFTELARRQGTLHEAEFSVIAEWYKWLEEHAELPLDLIIYLRTSPDVVFQRMQSRGRSEESSVPLKYLSDLHETYEDWLIHEKIEEADSAVPRKYKVLVVDANKSKNEVAIQCRQLVSEFLARKTNTDDAGKSYEGSPTKKPKFTTAE